MIPYRLSTNPSPDPIDSAIRQQYCKMLDLLTANGYRVRQVSFDPACFGNCVLDCTGRRPTFRIVRDRGELRIEADPDLNPPQPVFTNPIEFAAAILLWADAVEDGQG